VTQAFTPRPVGWNTWDVQFHTATVHLPTGLRLRLGLRAPDGSVTDGFTWRRGLVRLGHHTADGTYAQAVVSAAETVLDLQFAGGENDVTLAASIDGPAELAVIVDRVDGIGSAAGVTLTPSRYGAELVVDGRSWRLELSARAITVDECEGGGFLLAVPTIGTAPCHARLAPADDTAATPIPDQLEAVRNAALSHRLRSSGWLDDAADAYVRSVTWNSVYAPDLGRVLTPTSRDFVCAERDGFYGRWAIHTWDTFFTGLVASWIDPTYARGIFDQIIDQADENGMLPNRVSDDKGRTDDRSQPPVGALTVLKAYLGSGLGEATRDRSLLTSSYPALRQWHDWWMAARRGPFGLLAWGSDLIPGDPDSATVDRARRESGLDDSPMYDDVSYDPQTRTMDLADVGLNALHIADADALAAIADRIGDTSAAVELRREAETERNRLGDLLWDPERGEYRNRWKSGSFSEHVSPTMLYPLLAGAPTIEQARSLVAGLLMPDVLGGNPPLPSAARNDPSFSTRYWRGRIWAPMVYLAVSGLRHYGFASEARAIVDALLSLFLDEWHRHSHVRENYPVTPGEDVRELSARSDGLMSWGSLLAYLAFQELADPRPAGWRFAHPGTPAELAGLPLGEGSLSIRAADRLIVELDGAPLIDAPPNVVIEEYTRDDRMVSGVAISHGSAASVGVTRPGSTGELVQIDVPEPGVPVPFRLEGAVPSADAPAPKESTTREQ
jgi:putative isomerase